MLNFVSNTSKTHPNWAPPSIHFAWTLEKVLAVANIDLHAWTPLISEASKLKPRLGAACIQQLVKKEKLKSFTLFKTFWFCRASWMYSPTPNWGCYRNLHSMILESLWSKCCPHALNSLEMDKEMIQLSLIFQEKFWSNPAISLGKRPGFQPAHVWGRQRDEATRSLDTLSIRWSRKRVTQWQQW